MWWWRCSASSRSASPGCCSAWCFPVVGLGYNAVTIGGKNSATIGQRLMGLEVRMWFGGKVSAAGRGLPSLLFWFSLVVFCPILLWALFDPRKRCLHDILAGVLFINRP